MSTLFVTASGTGVGKTFVTTLLIRALRRAGLRVMAFKPVATGFDPQDLESSDTGEILRALGLPATSENVSRVTPWRFRAPLSPDMAADRERRSIPFETLVAHTRDTPGADITLVEGVGGAMVPLDREHTVLDWIAALEAPALLVAGSYLGTLSHTLTAAVALEARGVPLAAVIVSESEEQPVPVAETVQTLERFVSVPVVAVPRLRAGEPFDPQPLLDALASHLPSKKGPAAR